jgi:hypothetical protein
MERITENKRPPRPSKEMKNLERTNTGNLLGRISTGIIMPPKLHRLCERHDAVCSGCRNEIYFWCTVTLICILLVLSFVEISLVVFFASKID